MRRRDFLKVIAGSAVSFPLDAHAQQPDRMRRIGVLMNLAVDDPEGQVRLKTFLQELQRQGWTDGRNVRVDTCWGGGQAERYPTCAAELVGLAPDVILAGSGAAMPALLEATHSLSIVFVQTIDPVGLGYVASLAAPGGNTTGFTQFEFSMGGKWLELLKQASPLLERVGLIYNPQLIISDTGGYFPPIEEAARSLAVKLIKLPYRDTAEIVHQIDAFAADSNGGLIVMPPPPNAANREAIVRLAVQHQLPSMHLARQFVAEGGLLSYGSNPGDRGRRPVYVRSTSDRVEILCTAVKDAKCHEPT